MRPTINLIATNELEEANLAKVREAMDFIAKSPTVSSLTVMPDACPVQQGHIPVGGIATAKNAIHPEWHSADICCSVFMTDFGKADPKEVLDRAHSITHFGPGGREAYSELPEDLVEDILANPFLGQKALELARWHLGTQGDGNHFLFVGKSDLTGNTCMVTHHGSRGMGAYLYKRGTQIANTFRRQYFPNVPKELAWIPADAQEGKDYWEALQITRRWTKLNHTVLHDAIDLPFESRLWNEHNFVFQDGPYYHHAKGATPIRDAHVPDNNTGLRLIPLNMSEPVLVVSGEHNNRNNGFAPHGAGRNMSRRRHVKNLLQDSTKEEILARETEGLDVRFYSGLPDLSELPSAYKNADEVRKQIDTFNLATVEYTIQPYGCIMAGQTDWKKVKRKRQMKTSEGFAAIVILPALSYGVYLFITWLAETLY